MSDPIPPDVITETSLNRQLPEIGREQIIKALDLAVLKPDARLEDVTNAARVVEDMGLASLCVASYNVAVAKQITSRVCSVIGFPHGNMSPQTKYLEAAAAIEDGATELDIVMNYGRFLEGRDTVVVQELGALSSCAHEEGARQGDPRNVLLPAGPDHRSLPPVRGLRCGLRETVHRFCLRRGDTLGRGTDAGSRQGCRPSQGQWRHQDLRRCGALISV